MGEQKRGRLSSGARADLQGHVKSCEACKQEEAIDSVMDVALQRLAAEPPPSASETSRAPASGRMPPLRARLAEAHENARSGVRRRRLWGLFGLTLLGLGVVFFPKEPPTSERDMTDPLVREAVNDHVRVISAKTPVEYAGDTVEKVGPQLAPRLTFAPVNAFGGDQDTKLTGGSVAYYIDRPAAAYVYQREAHVVTVIVCRAEGLPWRSMGSHNVVTSHGYRTVIFRRGDLGYAIVSDIPEAALVAIAVRVDVP